MELTNLPVVVLLMGMLVAGGCAEAGEFNAPWVFLNFYAHNSCTKCRIGDLSLHASDRRQLFALKPAHLLPQFTYVTRHTVNYPNGDVAFLLVEAVGSHSNGARPLLGTVSD